MNTLDLLHGNYWQFNIVTILIALLLIIFQLRTGKNLPARKNILFYTGILLLLVITVTPIAFIGNHYLFSIHMVNHIIILLLIPPLLLTGVNPKILEKLKSSKFRKIGDFIFSTPVAWILGMGAMYLWHVPAIFEAMMHSPWLHAIHVVSLLVLGAVFIWPVYSPIQWKRLEPMQSALYLFVACTGCTVLGILITFAPSSVYIPYMHGSNAAVWELIRSNWGINAAIDQQAGGLIMWVPACIIYVTNIMLILAGYFNQPDNETI